MSKILEVKNATKRFGGLVANEKVTFDVDEGEIVGVVGPNGAGKTTLFNSISGAHPLTEGNIIFDGKRHYNDETSRYLQTWNWKNIPDSAVTGRAESV